MIDIAIYVLLCIMNCYILIYFITPFMFAVGEQSIPVREVVLHIRQGGPLYRISDQNPAYQVLHFPLLFPQGVGGFVADIAYRRPDIDDEVPLFQLAEHRRRAQAHQKVTLMDWAGYMVQQRNENMGYTNHIVQASRLFHEFLVDLYIQIEGQRLSYLRHNQRVIRSELYRGLHDALYEHDQNVDRPMLGHEVGVVHPVVLPSSFVGSPRDMQQRYQDAMAIVRECGKPDLFITMTTNPNWPEIRDALLPGEVLLNLQLLHLCIFNDVS